ncbi:MAG TPA: DUF2892 domain-containing protein [Armatimonadota bacterium]|nr:DUF2892 domain-containing protein [Armatimonadota bacterium]HPP76211.1 DUF2892 domain-containing protein [Armatimonadota bacterium]
MRVECNVGGTDRTTRIGIGAALLGLGLLASMSKPLKIASSVIGAVGLTTGLARYCPVSKALHINTCRTISRPSDVTMPLTD